MRLALALIVFAALSIPVHAQQSVPIQSTPMEQALGAKLMEEINSNIQLRTQMVGLQQQVNDLQAKLKDKPPEPPKK